MGSALETLPFTTRPFTLHQCWVQFRLFSSVHGSMLRPVFTAVLGAQEVPVAQLQRTYMERGENVNGT